MIGSLDSFLSCYGNHLRRENDLKLFTNDIDWVFFDFISMGRMASTEKDYWHKKFISQRLSAKKRWFCFNRLCSSKGQ